MQPAPPAAPAPNPNRVQWWNLDREGNVVPLDQLPERDEDSPPLKDNSPFTPTFLIDGHLPETHLHYEDGRIVGIHGEASLSHLRVTLRLCLEHEQEIINHCPRFEGFDIMLNHVLDYLLNGS